MSTFNNLAEKQFGKLISHWPVGKTRSGKVLWLCHCECGKYAYKTTSDLVTGHTISCGCHREQGTQRTHGLARSREYKIYIEARRRCTKPDHLAFPHYGGRGIEFRFKSFEEFYKSVGPRPEGTTIDRKNNDGHYEPGNVRWATWTEQAANKRTPRKRGPWSAAAREAHMSANRAKRELKERQG